MVDLYEEDPGRPDGFSEEELESDYSGGMDKEDEEEGRTEQGPGTRKQAEPPAAEAL